MNHLKLKRRKLLCEKLTENFKITTNQSTSHILLKNKICRKSAEEQGEQCHGRGEASQRGGLRGREGLITGSENEWST